MSRHFHFTPLGFSHPQVRPLGRLLGPCFKTGGIRPSSSIFRVSGICGIASRLITHRRLDMTADRSRRCTWSSWYVIKPIAHRPLTRSHGYDPLMFPLIRARRSQTRQLRRAAQPTLTSCVEITQRPMGLLPFAPNDFKVFFTLFPKCFSSFVHTTCSLSVLVQYLAFAEVHLRLCTALSNCATLGVLGDFAHRRPDGYGTIALLGRSFHGGSSDSMSSPSALALQFHSFRLLPLRIHA